MEQHRRIILAIMKKDIVGLLPLVLLAAAIFLLQPVIASLDATAAGGDVEFLVAAQANFYWIGYLLACLLMISVLQQDPADSLTHDWLARPVPRADWLLAKLLFIVLTIAVPVVLGRFITFVSEGHGVLQALAFAAAVEKLPAVLVVPLLLTIGLLTSSLRRTVLLLVLVTLVFLLPAWSVTRPLLELFGIELGSELGAMMWLQAVPMLVAGSAGAAAVFWLLYCRRLRTPAMWAFVASVAGIFISVYPPASLLDWNRAIDLHRSLINGPDAALERSVVLQPVQACFPATFVSGPDSTDAGSDLLMKAGWLKSQLAAAGPEPLTFATTIRAREILAEWVPSAVAGHDIPMSWRVDRVRAQATLSSSTLGNDVQLVRSFMAENRYGKIAAVDTDYWLLPAAIAAAAADDPSTRLTIEYDLALLSPHAYELQVDGELRDLPKLGACRALHDANANTIEVECTKRGRQAALISAELVGVGASRVDSATRANFTPAGLEFVGRRQTLLTLDKPSLVDSSSILVTAYEVERVLTTQLVSEGILGADTSACPLPAAGTLLSMDKSAWSDSAPHEVNSIAVEPGVRVEVLDWRSGGEPRAVPTLLLLPGLAATAHSYDALAARLSADYNVVAMTRRGTGASSKPDRGYDIARLSQDVLQVSETLGIEKPILVGHSIGGEELNFLGANHPERLTALIYLDAAYDRVSATEAFDRKRARELNTLLPTQPAIYPSEASSYEGVMNYNWRTRGSRRLQPEGEILASYDLGTGTTLHDQLYLDAIAMGLKAPDYPRIAVPALGVYAVPTSAATMMERWYDADDPDLRQAVAELYQMDRQGKAAQMARFDREIPDSEVVAIDDADHWIFVSHEDEVLAAMQRFIARVVQ